MTRLVLFYEILKLYDEIHLNLPVYKEWPAVSSIEP